MLQALHSHLHCSLPAQHADSCTCFSVPALTSAAAIHDGAERVVLRQGRVKDPPAQLSAVWRMEAFGPVVPTGSEFSDELSDEHLAMGAPQDAAAQAEDRAARVAMRRYARDAALGLPVPRQQQQKAAVRARSGGTAVPVVQRKAERPHARAASARAPPASPILHQGGNVRGPPAARGELPAQPVLCATVCQASWVPRERAAAYTQSLLPLRCPPAGVKRVPVCMWCHSDEFHLLGCAACHRCFCFKCFQRRPGLGVNNWSRAGAPACGFARHLHSDSVVGLPACTLQLTLQLTASHSFCLHPLQSRMPTTAV